VYRYRLHYGGGSDAGEGTYAVWIKPGEEIVIGGRPQVARPRRRADRGGGLAVRRVA